MTNQQQTMPVKNDAGINNLLNEAQQGAGFEKRLTFKQGLYYCDKAPIEPQIKMVAQCVGWAKKWVKFVDRRPVESMIYRVYRGEHAPERDRLDDNNKDTWPKRPDGQPMDPWVLQFLLPMINEQEELVIFTTSSKGGWRGVSDLVTVYARRAQRQPNCGQPIVRLGVTQMPTTSFGNVPRPCFNVIGWDDGATLVHELSDEALKKADFDDEIPF